MIFGAIGRAAVRGTQLVFHLALGVLLACAYRLYHGRLWHEMQPGRTLLHRWTHELMRIIGVRVSCYGKPLTANVLFVSNHISFLDIIVISAFVPVRFLAKHSVRYWPVIGYLAAISGSLFIERGKRSQLGRTLVAMKLALAGTRPVLIFPEGTTSLGTQVLSFHSGLFQAAVDHKIPVQTLTLHYRRDHRPDRLAAYIDQDNFLISLLRLLAQPQTEAHLSFTPAVDTGDLNRQQLAAFCHARISQNLQFQLQTPDNSNVLDFYFSVTTTRI